MTPSKRSEIHRKYVNSNIARGLCVECSHKALPNNRRCRKHREAAKQRDARRRQALARETIMKYGGKCTCCGESNYLFLTLDHPNNDGFAHRHAVGTKGGTAFYHQLKKAGWPSGLRVMCFNCNCGRARNGGTCPHYGLRSHTTDRLRSWRHDLFVGAIEGYGGECSCCGVKTLAFLTLDHPNRNSKLHRKSLGINSRGGYTFYLKLRNLGYPSGLRVMCFNCNCGRERNHGVCPHNQSSITLVVEHYSKQKGKRELRD